MRDPERIDRILKKIGDKWKERPDLRLLQFLIVMLGGKNIRYDLAREFDVVLKPDPFYIEDEVLERVLDEVSKPKLSQ